MAQRGDSSTLIERAISNVPEGTRSLYSILPPNQPTKVFRGRVRAKPGHAVLSQGRLDYQWLPSTTLRFSGSVQGSSDQAKDLSHLRAPKNGAWIPVIVTKARSEEHTSELQSLAYLICRLLLA